MLTDNTALFITTEEPDIVEPAQAGFDADQFSIAVEPASSSQSTLRISNSGEANLGFNISKNYDLTRDSQIVRDGGGPDDYGYLWMDSNEPGGPEFQWIDISGYGTQIQFTHNDNSPGIYSIGFDVDFYGTTYSTFRVNPNGWIGFGDDASTYTNTGIPSTSAPRPAIFPFWDDLYPESNGGSGLAYYHTDGERLIVMFDNVDHWNSSMGPYTFEMILYADGSIKFQYLDMNQTVDSATIGMQNASGNDGLEMAYNNSYIEDNLAISIFKVVDWLTVTPTSGSVANGEYEDISIEVTSDELEIGEYSCTMFISTSDPLQSLVEIPVNLTVAEFIMEAPQGVEVAVIDGDNPRVSIAWNSVTGATSYNIYASDDPTLEFEQWTQIASNITGTNWMGELNENYRFFKVTAEN